MSKLLIDEPPLQVLPSLALRIGLNESIVLQQIHYLLRNPKFGRRIEEHQWIFNTVEEWVCNYFPFWCPRTLKTIFANLERMNLVVTCQPEGRMSRRKYYRIDMERMDRLAEGANVARSIGQASEGAKIVPSMGQELHDGNGQHLPLPNAKTSSETSQRLTTGKILPNGDKTQNSLPQDPSSPNTKISAASDYRDANSEIGHLRYQPPKTTPEVARRGAGEQGDPFQDSAEDPDFDDQPALLPLPAKPDPKKKARGTLEEFQAFAKSIDLPPADGESMYWKFEASDWKNGRNSVKDWRATMRQWKAAGYHPSQNKRPANGVVKDSRPAWNEL